MAPGAELVFADDFKSNSGGKEGEEQGEKDGGNVVHDFNREADGDHAEIVHRPYADAEGGGPANKPEQVGATDGTAKNWRLPRLARALSAKSHVDALPAALFGTTYESFRDEHEDLHYAMARYLCQWLDARNQLWPFYRAFRDHRAEDPTGRATFAKVVGKSPEEIGETWRSWALNL